MIRQRMNRKNILILILILSISAFLFQNGPANEAQASSLKSYTVKTGTKSLNPKYLKFSTYNSYTKQYYMLRSYLEQLEINGGGTLTLSSGTYKISNTLYIPSNVTLNLKDGVIIKKIDKTGVAGMVSSKSLFQLVAPTKALVKGAYGGYNGVSDINITGTGTAIIDLNYDTDCVGIMMCHNSNVRIAGITFQNMKGGHFIEMDASQKVTVENNNFLHHQPSSTGIKEAINIDTPDKNTNGFHAVWTNYDCTPDKDVLIQNNYFYDLERAIGTHKYSGGKYHENVQLLNNRISTIDSDAIRILNWTNPVVKGNEISLVAGGVDNKRAILVSGATNPDITENTFEKVSRPIQIMPWKNDKDGSQYEITYNEISQDNITRMLNNTLIDVQERFIRVNKIYNKYDSDTDKYYFMGEQED